MQDSTWCGSLVLSRRRFPNWTSMYLCDLSVITGWLQEWEITGDGGEEARHNAAVCLRRRSAGCLSSPHHRSVWQFEDLFVWMWGVIWTGYGLEREWNAIFAEFWGKDSLDDKTVLNIMSQLIPPNIFLLSHATPDITLHKMITSSWSLSPAMVRIQTCTG